MCHIMNGDQFGHEYKLYVTIKNFQLRSVGNISNGGISGTEQNVWELIYNTLQIKLFRCTSKYTNIKSFILRDHPIRELMW